MSRHGNSQGPDAREHQRHDLTLTMGRDCDDAGSLPMALLDPSGRVAVRLPADRAFGVHRAGLECWVYPGVPCKHGWRFVNSMVLDEDADNDCDGPYPGS